MQGWGREWAQNVQTDKERERLTFVTDNCIIVTAILKTSKNQQKIDWHHLQQWKNTHFLNATPLYFDGITAVDIDRIKCA